MKLFSHSMYKCQGSRLGRLVETSDTCRQAIRDGQLFIAFLSREKYKGRSTLCIHQDPVRKICFAGNCM